jgi:ribosomal protein S18 acetylase RimI-like enzyme
MHIRLVRPDEYEELGALTVAAYEVVQPGLGGYADSLRDVADRAQRSTVLVAVDESDLLGGVTYVSGPDDPYAEGLEEGQVGIRMLAVADAVQGRGVGRALTVACIERGRAAGARAVALHSTSTMTVAHELYSSLGFARRPEHDIFVDDGVHLMSFLLRLDAGTLGDRPGWRNRQAQGA